jgi:acyl carrier protein
MSRSVEEIQQFLVKRLAEMLKRSSDEIDHNRPFADYGMDSVASVGLVVDLEGFMGTRLDPAVVWDFPTVGALAQHLAVLNRAS